jgi:hypothetical protein
MPVAGGAPKFGVSVGAAVIGGAPKLGVNVGGV